MPIRWRLTLFYTLATLAIVVLLAITLTTVVVRAIHVGGNETARARAFEAARLLESAGALSAADLARLSADSVVVIVRDGHGQVLAQTSNLHAKADGPDSGIWQRALTSGQPWGDTVEGAAVGTDGPIYLYAVPIARPDTPARVVEAGKGYSATGMALFEYAYYFALAAVAGIPFAIGGAYLLARASLAPVDAFVQSAQEITEGNLARRLPVRSPSDELGRLAVAFNDLLARLEIAFAAREETLAHQRRFVADASHELRTPLTSILGYARMLRTWGLNEPAVARESVAAMEDEGTRMSELVEGLLCLARGDEGVRPEPGTFDLREVADGAVEAARTVANGKVAITVALPAHPVSADAERDRIYQAVAILLDNAVKYTPAGGTVTLAVQAVDEGVEARVTDTGPGITAEHLPHIFERFYRVNDARTAGGAGLGLAIARQIAEAHGGRIDVVSCPGRGSTFTLYLPAQRVDVERRGPPATPEPLDDPGGTDVLPGL
jgi:signal transduction histidine kinase